MQPPKVTSGYLVATQDSDSGKKMVLYVLIGPFGGFRRGKHHKQLRDIREHGSQTQKPVELRQVTFMSEVGTI